MEKNQRYSCAERKRSWTEYAVEKEPMQWVQNKDHVRHFNDESLLKIDLEISAAHRYVLPVSIG